MPWMAIDMENVVNPVKRTTTFPILPSGYLNIQQQYGYIYKALFSKTC